MVVEVPPGVLGPVDDAYFRWVTDIGVTGPDKGKGGKYLFVPPGYSGSCLPRGILSRSPKLTANLIFFRAFVQGGDIAAAANGVKPRPESIRCPPQQIRRRNHSSTHRECS